MADFFGAPTRHGLWTPELTGSSGNPTVTWNQRSADYFKAGPLVMVRLALEFTVSAIGGGSMGITGLPFEIDDSLELVGSGNKEPNAGLVRFIGGFSLPAGTISTELIAEYRDASAQSYLYINFRDGSPQRLAGFADLVADGVTKHFLSGSVAYRAAA